MHLSLNHTFNTSFYSCSFTLYGNHVQSSITYSLVHSKAICLVICGLFLFPINISLKGSNAS